MALTEACLAHRVPESVRPTPPGKIREAIKRRARLGVHEVDEPGAGAGHPKRTSGSASR